MNNTIVATFAYIVNEENKVLLVRRAMNDTFPGQWELPGGGLDSGERPELSIEREVLEEAGLHVKSGRPLSVITHKNQDGEDVVRITYACNMTDPTETVKLSSEHDAFQWVAESELETIGKNTILFDVWKEMNGYRITA